MENKYTYLCVPDGISLPKWRHLIIYRMPQMKCVLRYVFHSKHVKIKATRKPRLNYTKMIKVKDRTDHFDVWLSNITYKIIQRIRKKGYNYNQALSVITHLLYNAHYEGYNTEFKYHMNRSQRLFKAVQKVTEEDDHGWELKELRRAGLIK